VTTAAEPTHILRGPGPSSRHPGLLLLLTGLLGLAASLVLGIEKFRLLENPLYVPACTLGGAVDCGSVMASDQASAFGFPNPFLGLAGFAGVAMTGLAVVSGAKPGPWFWLVVQAGLTFAVLFVHWLIFQGLYRVGALCPFCIAVWLGTIPAFWYVTLHNLRTTAARPGPFGLAARAARGNHGIVLTVWLLAVAALVAERFWAPWGSVFA
jgi:uncharacterized membrane protein